MSDSERGLVTAEGVDEGSAASSADADIQAPASDAVLGRPGSPDGADAEQDAAPVPVGDPADSDLPAPGQQLQVGEG